MAGPAPLRINGLTGGYGRLTVLHDVSLEVAAGQALGIHGPNGAGKSTLLKIVAGALPAQAGSVELGGQRLDGLPSHRRVRRGLALVPEGRQVIGSISVQANLDMMVLARGRLALDAEHRKRCGRVLELFPALQRRLEVPAGSLSGGEQQMLAIGRALMCAPAVMLLDEPSQGLAPAIVAELGEILRSLKGEMTIVLVEQSEHLLAGVSDVRHRLRMGRIEDDVATPVNSEGTASSGSLERR
jgi:branched-chain amino acid transport system ATP-binding protein